MKAAEAKMIARIEAIGKARAAIVTHLEVPGKKGRPSGQGRITCPVCMQPDALIFMRSVYNGHIHAACRTQGCVSWME